jgi:tight adherence protein B
LRRLALVLLALVLGALPALAQTEQPAVEIVDINASRYADGGFVTMVLELRNLDDVPDTSAVEITANGEPVSDLEVVPLRDSAVPTGVVLTIDASGSMEGAPLDAAKAAAQAFVSQMRPSDRIALVSFADEVQVLSGFTNNVEELNTRIESIEANGETAFNDAVIRSVELFDAASARDLLPNIIVLTDGEDTVSTASLEEAVSAIGGSDARVFGVALDSEDFNPDPVAQIAAAGDGLFLSTPDPEQLSALYEEIGREISNTLVARFVSPISTPGDVDFSVSYQNLTASDTFAVSGFAVTTTTAAGTTTTTTLGPVEGFTIENNAPLDLSTLILVSAAGVGLTIFLFLIILFGREDEEDSGRFAKRLQAYGRRGSASGDEKKGLLERLPLLNRFTEAAEEEVKRRGLLSGISSTLEQANIPMTPGEAILAMIALSAVGGVFLAIFNGLLVGVIGFGVLLLLFYFAINFAGSREKKKFEQQLPDTLTLLSTSLRAGYSLLQATEAVASEAQNPTAREFGRAISEARLGMSVTDTLRGIVDRTQSEDFEWAVMAIDIQREVGGNLAEVLQTVADTMRARNRLKGEIRALTAEGRISAFVLGSLPFALFGFLWFSNRDYLLPLIESTFGIIAIGVGIILMGAGVFWLKKIVDIEI